MAVLLANNATSKLASSLTAAATTLSVTTGEGAKFPSPTGGDWFPLTLIKSSGALEILRCTARSGDVFTVTRAQEGTAAQAFSAGDRVEVRLTKAVMDAIVQQINDLTNSALLDANNLSDLTNAATARANLGLGSAATKAAQTSFTDTTGGALMAVGAFGLGGLNALIGSIDLNAFSKTGFYMGPNFVNAPLASADWFYVLHQEHGGAGFSSQIAIDLVSSTPKTYQRQKAGGIWSSWYEVWNSSTLPVTAFAKTLLDDADAAAARATLDVYSKAEANGIAIGVGQTWLDVTASRASGTTYTNTTGKPISVIYTTPTRTNTNDELVATVSGVVVRRDQNGTNFKFRLSAEFTVPPGATYSITTVLGGAGIWVELR